MSAKQSIAGRMLDIYGDIQSGHIFLQPVDEHDAELMESEAQKLEALCGHKNWCIITVPVTSWNQELTPWKSAPVFGKEGFGDGAAKTLKYITANVIPFLDRSCSSESGASEPGLSESGSSEPSLPESGSSESGSSEPGLPKSGLSEPRRCYLCGYSLAGLFALWSSYQTDLFAGIVAASPSVWYPDWIAYAREHTIRTSRVYLSLGLKEEKARNKVMAAVGDAIRTQYSLLQDAGTDCTLEWNEGNHFADSDGRMAKGLAWMLGDHR